MPADSIVRTCILRMTPRKFSKMAAVGGIVAQENHGGFSFENCKRFEF